MMKKDYKDHSDLMGLLEMFFKGKGDMSEYEEDEYPEEDVDYPKEMYMGNEEYPEGYDSDEEDEEEEDKMDKDKRKDLSVAFITKKMSKKKKK
jgi:hypothetical protein